MRKFHQEQVLELIKTLYEAHSELMRLRDEQEVNTFVGLLADCQDYAIQIGQYIERNEGMGTVTVFLLEEYCDILYFASNETDNDVNVLMYIERLQEQLGRIRNSVTNELKQSKIEIAFLPYKASMWDSCESVWLAAKADPQCDAYVVPIPYFDKNSDGTVGRMHYEGNQFPEYVPIVDWQSYKLEERRPDIIVTINPYDNGNRVTAVHADFFCKRLKDFTDLLVYIPYFVSLDDVDAHFCTCAGVLHADRVFVQSEKIRQTYLRVIQQFELKNQCIGYFGNLKEKIVALGSPKFDKVINSKREDYTLPDSWSRLIERSDGSRRKVVLYNTSIAYLLEGNEKVLDKMRDVFETFRKREDVVLLWRPHPLNQSTYQSMRPQLLAEYDRIVKEYKRNQFGIYDETADLYRAIAVSDAYYGDGGSLLALNACTGKPLMVQELSAASSANETLRPQNIYDDGRYLWFTARNLNGLFRMNKASMAVQCMTVLNGPPEGNLYFDVAEYEGKLYFSPYFAEYVAIYDMKTNEIEKVFFETKEKPDWLLPTMKHKFTKVFRYKNGLFFAAFSYPAIVRYDLETGEMSYHSEWLNHMEFIARKSKNYKKWDVTSDFNFLFFPGRSAIGSEIVFNLYMSNELMFFNMDTLEHRFYKIGGQDERFWGVCFDGKFYWIVSKVDNYVVKWERKSQSYERITLPDDMEKRKDSGMETFQAIVYAEGYVWLFPSAATVALKIDVTSNRISRASELELDSSEGVKRYLNIIQNDNVIYGFTVDSVLRLDAGTQESKVYNIPMPVLEKDQIKLLKWRRLPKDLKRVLDTVYSENQIGLNAYLDYVELLESLEFAKAQSDRQVELCGELTNDLSGTSGQAIYSYCVQNAQKVSGGAK